MTSSRALEFLRTDPLRTTRVVPDPLPAPGPGELLFEVERFTLTSNNVTYARRGDALGYWAPFPAGEEGWGRVPAWGLARVVDGDPALAAPGELFLGYVPMATHVLVRAEAVSHGLRATAPEWAGMHPLYRDLLPVSGDVDDTGLAVLPGVPAAAHLGEELRGAARVVVSSATSRTAITAAVLLRRAGVPVVGLTAATRVGRAERAEVYDEVLDYDHAGDVRPAPGTVYVDVAGRPEVTAAVARALGSTLVRSLRVGVTQPDDEAPVAVPGPAVEQFNVGLRRVEVAAERGEEQLIALERRARDPLVAWAGAHLVAERVPGLEGAREAWTRTWRGEVDPLAAVTVVPRPGTP
ncbi:DUF2855 family protein [Actinomycetospora atypica]|uniref:DUF2855 family protein n=1 Tax=Actinomycetospora atypica TaxID=1290095 RepID=A0ABV9YL24_9PSEU